MKIDDVLAADWLENLFFEAFGYYICLGCHEKSDQIICTDCAQKVLKKAEEANNASRKN